MPSPSDIFSDQNPPNILIYGVDDTGAIVPVLVDTTGKFIYSGSITLGSLYLTDVTGANKMAVASDGSLTVNVKEPFVVQDTFTNASTGLTGGVGTYTVNGTYTTYMRVQVDNMSATNAVVFTIGGKVVTIGAGKSKDLTFPKATTIAVSGTSPTFNAVILG